MDIRFYTLQHVPAQDMLPTVRSFLSETGTAVADQATNLLIVSDTPERLAVIEAIVARLDQPLAQVMVRARLIESGREFLRRLGVDWSVDGRIQLGNTARVAFAGGYYFLPLDRDLWVKARVLLEEDRRLAESVSSAQVLTLGGHRAELSVGTRVPLPLVSRRGYRSFVYEDVLFTLFVTPRPLSGGKIQLDVSLKEDTLGSRYRIERQAVATSVVVENGEAVLIGGADRQVERSSSEGIPGLMDMPLLGRVFQTESTGKEETTLTILIQPSVVH